MFRPSQEDESVFFRPDQVRRYARHILLPDVGGVGQKRFLTASVVIEVGPGCAAEMVALTYLAAAGVGNLVLSGDLRGAVDRRDVRDGIVFAATDIGRERIDAIAERIQAINPDVAVTAVDESDDKSNARPLAGPVQLDVAGGPPIDFGRQLEYSVADALVSGGLRAVRTLYEILSHEPA
ncbi:MAG: ThiF family adenylyltransferase [Proteobacteria bacterium]|nr:ThiF family adenylyltransferase [Pseudomonadota bacterium]